MPIYSQNINWNLGSTLNALQPISLLRPLRSPFQLHRPALPTSLLPSALAPAPPFVPAAHTGLHLRSDVSAYARILADARGDLYDRDGRIHVSATEW